MRYIGGKSKIAKSISEYIRANANGRTRYVEPFLGGGASFARVAPEFPQAHTGDVVPDLVMMWMAARDGWQPPTHVDDELYESLRHAEPSPLRGFVGFGCSFGGKWFGGRARGGFNSDGSPRNYAAESARAVARIAPHMRGAEILLKDYRSWDVNDNTVVYCDPPYANTQGYRAASEEFDSNEFWNVVRQWNAKGALVVVSEYTAPDEWIPVVTRAHRQTLQGGRGARPTTTESLWARAA